MSDEKEIKAALNDLFDIVLDLTEQINALGLRLAAIQIVLEEKVPGFAEELKLAHIAAENASIKSDREFASNVEQSLRSRRKKFPQ